MTPEQKFENELEIFRTETQTAVQFFYAYLTIHAVARDRPAVHRLLNRAPLFWNTNLGALQTGSFIVLGRIFDQTSRHNVDRLLKIGQTNLGIFSKAALGARKQRADPGAAAWLGAYLKDAYAPMPKDFRHLRSLVRKHRATYEAKYRDLRHKLFAHKEVSNPADVSALFAKTNVRELQRSLAVLARPLRCAMDAFCKRSQARFAHAAIFGGPHPKESIGREGRLAPGAPYPGNRAVPDDRGRSAGRPRKKLTCDCH